VARDVPVRLTIDEQGHTPGNPGKGHMSGPGGEVTERDRRRETRRQQYLQRQEQARRARQQKIRNQQLRQWGLIGGGAVVFLLLLVFIIHAVTAPSTPPSSYWQHPAQGQTVDGIPCQASEQVAVHHHSYLKVYIDGSQVQVPGGIGIPTSADGFAKCLYWLHVHPGQNNSEYNFIHIEAPPNQANTTFTVKQFFDIGGESLGGTSFMGKTIDGNHKLVTEVFDANGKLVQTANGADDAGKIALSNHETIVMLYNSPNVKATPNTDWSQVG
jgi:hypothetical protein